MERSVLRISVWHHAACRVIKNSDYEDRCLYSILIQVICIIAHPLIPSCLYLIKRLPEVPEYAEMRHNIKTLL